MAKSRYAILILILLTACAGATPTLVPTSEFTVQVLENQGVVEQISDPEVWQDYIRNEWILDTKFVFILADEGRKDVGIELSEQGKLDIEEMSKDQLTSIANDLYQSIKLLYPSHQFSIFVYVQFYDTELKDEYGRDNYEFEFKGDKWLVAQTFIEAHFLLGEKTVKIW